jgi:hypothetical protein
MSENLSNFLVDLASDPARMARFMVNPVSELDDTALTPEERTIVIAADADQLRRTLALAKSNGSQVSQVKKKKKGGKKKGGKKKGGKKR